MAWLVIAHAWDDAARWAAEQLPTVGLELIHYLTDIDLAQATWTINVDSKRTRWEIGLLDGRVISEKDFDGALNRLIQAPPETIMALQQDDRAYGHQEFSAMLLAWLNGLSGPVINRASPRGLCGEWRSPAEWAMLASQAGLDVARVQMSAEVQGMSTTGEFQLWPPFEGIEPDAIVLGDAFFGRDPMNEATITASQQLAILAETQLIGLKFGCTVCSDTPELTGVTPFPDFRLGGDAFLSALRDALAGE